MVKHVNEDVFFLSSPALGKCQAVGAGPNLLIPALGVNAPYTSNIQPLASRSQDNGFNLRPLLPGNYSKNWLVRYGLYGRAYRYTNGIVI